MISLGKILLFAAVAVAGYVGWSIYKRSQKRRIEAERAAEPPRPIAAAETAKCRVCGAYVAAGAGACGKDGCPY
jgi:uncharacterized membrane protein YebE (DUF533 family)